MEAKLELGMEARVLQAVLAAAKSISVDELNLKISKDGITMRNMDPSHVALVEASLPASMFTPFSVDGDSVLALPMEDTLKALSRFQKDSCLTLTSNEGKLKLKGKSNGRTLSYSLSTVEPVTSEPPKLKLDFATTVTLSRKSLAEILGDVEVIADHVKIASSKEQVLVVSGKSDAGEATTMIDKDTQGAILQVGEDSVAAYAISYLKDFLSSQSADTVKVAFSDKKPLMIEVREGSEGVIAFYLAPRIEDGN